MDVTHHSQPGSREADPTEGMLSPQMEEADLAHVCQWAGEPWKGGGDKVLKH